MAFKSVQTTLSAAVATSGTFTVSYPAGTNLGTYARSRNHQMYVRGHQRLYLAPTNFTLSFGASNITVTYLGTTAIPAGSVVTLQLDVLGDNRPQPEQRTSDKAFLSSAMIIRLGTPITASANAICTSQAITTTGTLNGALVTGGVAVLDVPRNVVAAWTNTAVLTVRGFDEYGVAITESSASGTSFTGAKAFKTVTSVTTSASITGATVGTGVVLGLPVYLPGTGNVFRELLNGAAATAGTIVAGVTSTATATTGDVRGTYNPNSAPDGSREWTLYAVIENVNDLGVAQFGG